jgi:prepilin-type processing-associated H-X9-DG protein
VDNRLHRGRASATYPSIEITIGFWKTTDVPGQYRIPVFADSTWHDGWPLATDEPAQMPHDFGGGNTGTTGEMNHHCIDRHNGWANFLFMDWSVRHVGLKELWTLKWHRAFDTNGPYTKAGGMAPSDWPAWLRKYKDY